MNKFNKPVFALSIFLSALFILAQFIFITTGSGGPWCSPALTAPPQAGHSMYQSVNYGFPFPFMAIVTKDCFSEPSTAYEWMPMGLVDVLILAMISRPIWSRFINKRSINKE